jgi:small subunit ribosomal protein S17
VKTSDSMAEKQKQKKEKKKSTVGTRGRTFLGVVIKKFPTRVVIEFKRTVYIQKYERYHKKNTRLHSRIPEGMDVQVGDTVRVQECRPLSKIIHSVVIEVVKSDASAPKAKVGDSEVISKKAEQKKEKEK